MVSNSAFTLSCQQALYLILGEGRILARVFCSAFDSRHCVILIDSKILARVSCSAKASGIIALCCKR